MLGEMCRRAIEEVGHWLRSDWSFVDVGEHWDAVEDYDDTNEETYSYYRRFIDGLRLSRDKIQPDAHILDFCARTGKGTRHFFERGYVSSAVCADVSTKQGGICRSRLREAGLQNFAWIPVSSYVFPFADGEFDVVLCFETVEHFARPETLIAELGRITRAGGLLILTTPNVLWEPIHALAAIAGLHHSEGPHRFVRLKCLLSSVRAAGYVIERAETTVLVPGGPAALIRFGEWLEERTQHSLMPLIGLRRVLVCRKTGREPAE